ncbi:amino acid ABC transporter ATP-binding protein [Romboutsia lituseburensis]|uniref:Amino acid ABC transporter ATP-binding protein, PAAT family n=1 Tax=Romboutsia lituseburensis DSM 797 TaxID=1121325 RepID=A0A1G9M3D6_9FIRM|nr:amino acid ABC transporter ATP-binding protein [Romboutsia lituseburensis]CEH34635.1 Glutamine transport ATP-binding protein GlnQ [Romboutsia lituseburensis]SDL68726.1 amino acid ABC transporter ATP-binding protein, PAAT family [Romboutsia lituseburensis DSM 797]
MLKVNKLNKSFGENKVLNDISFELKSGEIGVLLGKSGTGKTTILRCINGLEEFDRGEITVDDISIKNVKDINKIRNKTGMVFQNFNLFPHMSVLENIIQAPISVAKISKEEAVNTAKKLLKLVDLEDKINSYPFELSGGQKQRVAIARACALTPKVLCFDEPTSALDAESIKKVINIINELKNKKIAILIITHDIGFANEIGDKIINI